MNNQETQQTTSTDLPKGQPFSIDHGNQVWGPEGLYCECLEHATQQVCDALNIQASALFWLTFAMGKGVKVPEALIFQFRSTIGVLAPEIMEAANAETFDVAAEMGVIL